MVCSFPIHYRNKNLKFKADFTGFSRTDGINSVHTRYTTPCISMRRAHVSSILVCVCIQTCVMLDCSSVFLAHKVT